MSEIVVHSDDLSAPVKEEEYQVKHASKGPESRIQIKRAETENFRSRKAGKALTYPFKCISKLRPNSTTPNYSSSSSSSSSNFFSGISFGSSAKYPYFYGERPIGRCYFCCVSPPPVVEEDPVSGNKNRRNDDMPSVASYEHVKNLIESNKFYSADCNAHRDYYCTRIPPR